MRRHLGRQTMEKSIDKVPPVKLSCLDSVTKARYLEKLSIIDKTDPYTVEKKEMESKDGRISKHSVSRHRELFVAHSKQIYHRGFEGV